MFRWRSTRHSQHRLCPARRRWTSPWRSSTPAEERLPSVTHLQPLGQGFLLTSFTSWEETERSMALALHALVEVKELPFSLREFKTSHDAHHRVLWNVHSALWRDLPKRSASNELCIFIKNKHSVDYGNRNDDWYGLMWGRHNLLQNRVQNVSGLLPFGYKDHHLVDVLSQHTRYD